MNTCRIGFYKSMVHFDFWSSVQSVNIYTQLISILFALLVFSLPTHAKPGDDGDSHDRGNGAGLAECRPTRGVVTYRLVDVEEALMPGGPYETPVILPEGRTVEEKVENLIQRVEKIDPVRAGLWRKWFREFKKDSRSIKGGRLPTVNDWGATVIPNYCQPKQLIIQSEPNPVVGNPRYLINQDLFDKLDLDNQALTYTHEFAERETRLVGDPDSLFARTYNRRLMSDAFARMSLEEYIDTIRNLGMHLYTNSHGMPTWDTSGAAAGIPIFSINMMLNRVSFRHPNFGILTIEPNNDLAPNFCVPRIPYEIVGCRNFLDGITVKPQTALDSLLPKFANVQRIDQIRFKALRPEHYDYRPLPLVSGFEQVSMGLSISGEFEAVDSVLGNRVRFNELNWHTAPNEGSTWSGALQYRERRPNDRWEYPPHGFIKKFEVSYEGTDPTDIRLSWAIIGKLPRGTEYPPPTLHLIRNPTQMSIDTSESNFRVDSVTLQRAAPPFEWTLTVLSNVTCRSGFRIEFQHVGERNAPVVHSCVTDEPIHGAITIKCNFWGCDHKTIPAGHRFINIGNLVSGRFTWDETPEALR